MITDSNLSQGLIYQLFVGRWQSANIIDHKTQVFNRLKSQDFSKLVDIGVTYVYLLGVFDNRGEILVNQEEGQDLSTKPHRTPSVFAISDHTNTNPDLGTKQELIELIKSLKSQGLKVILDFVPNHTSLSHPWISSNLEFYHTHDGKPLREFSGDVAKLNYTNCQLTTKMNQVLETICSWGVDGIRCDMAHLVPIAFWSQAISHVKAKQKNIIFIAEAYADNLFDLSLLSKLVEAGFDYIYHEPFFRNLRQVFDQGRPLSDLVGHINYVSNSKGSHWLNYIGNHDDWLSSDAQTYSILLTLLYLSLPGMALVFNGQLNGLNHRLAHHYLELLPDNMIETNRVSDSIAKIFLTRKLGSLQLKQLELLDQDLLKLTYADKRTIVMNLTNRSSNYKNKVLNQGELLEIT